MDKRLLLLLVLGTNLGLGTMATKDGTGFKTLTVASSAPSSPATGDIWVWDTSISTGNYSTSEGKILGLRGLMERLFIRRQLTELLTLLQILVLSPP